MPAFEHDGFALYETQAILRYIDEGFPVSPLQPTDLHQFARMNQIMGIVDAYAWRAIAAGIVFNRVCWRRAWGCRWTRRRSPRRCRRPGCACRSSRG